MNLRAQAAFYGIELPDCGDSICVFGSAPGMRTNGGCRCNKKEPAVQLQRGIYSLIKLVGQIAPRLAAAEAAITFLQEHHDTLHMHASHLLVCPGEGCRLHDILAMYTAARRGDGK